VTTTGWTLSELTAQVADTLVDAAYAGAPNGRVRDVPDARAIRWYSTIGLVDRPSMQGRTALYGPRHLLQLVAIKRLQSRGMRIADIQAELAEAPDEVLRAIADLPAPPASPAARGDRFWTRPPVPHAPVVTVDVAHQPPELLSGLPLDGGAVLLLPGAPATDDIAAIRAAAQPLLDLLAARGLLHKGQTMKTGSAE